MKRLKIIVHGQVHDVSFRSSTKRTAEVLGLRGRVRNNPDGSVEITAEGADSSLQKLLEWVSRGPDRATITKIEHFWREPTGAHDDFQVEL